MCGVVGFWQPSLQAGATALMASATSMASAISYRGPDDHGVWADANSGIALGHRRLAIIDLSAQGHQPMHSASARYVIVFNGEIYNYEALRRDLVSGGLAPAWRGHSDTEVLLAAFEAWGVRRTLEQLVGMFVFALWDRQERALYLARDRLGEKPVYYGVSQGALAFASELRALTAQSGWQVRIDNGAVGLLLRHNYVPAPYSIYENVRKLEPASFLKVPFPSGGSFNEAAVLALPAERYWDARAAVEKGQLDPFAGSDAEAIERLDQLLRQAVRGQMISDVPLGAFLSGGIDSSTIVSLMQAQSSRPVKTFTIGFADREFNEAEHAAAIARHLGTDHTELYVTERDALEVVPSLPRLYNEPFSDSSQIPTYLVAKLARKHVTVSLSGDGGDELFAGYNRYFWGDTIWRRIGWLPQPVRDGLGSMIRAVPIESWDRIYGLFRPLMPRSLRHKRPGENAHKLARMFRSHSPDEMYFVLASHTDVPERYMENFHRYETTLTDRSRWAELPSFVQRMMYLDLVSYLPDDILVKVDRASMGVSLESRVPMLDHRVVEFAWRLPMRTKIRDGQSKWILRQVLDRYVPRPLVERPKMGFGVPLANWLRGPLRDWAEALLAEHRLRHDGIFRAPLVRKVWQEQLAGKKDWHYLLWNILMFQAWHAEQT